MGKAYQPQLLTNSGINHAHIEPNILGISKKRIVYLHTLTLI